MNNINSLINSFQLIRNSDVVFQILDVYKGSDDYILKILILKTNETARIKLEDISDSLEFTNNTIVS